MKKYIPVSNALFSTFGLTSCLQGSMNVHRRALLLVSQCISSFVFYILRWMCCTAYMLVYYHLVSFSICHGANFFVRWSCGGDTSWGRGGGGDGACWGCDPRIEGQLATLASSLFSHSYCGSPTVKQYVNRRSTFEKKNSGARWNQTTILK